MMTDHAWRQFPTHSDTERIVNDKTIQVATQHSLVPETDASFAAFCKEPEIVPLTAREADSIDRLNAALSSLQPGVLDIERWDGISVSTKALCTLRELTALLAQQNERESHWAREASRCLLIACLHRQSRGIQGARLVPFLSEIVCLTGDHAEAAEIARLCRAYAVCCGTSPNAFDRAHQKAAKGEFWKGMR